MAGADSGSGGGRAVVTDDADAFKEVADELGLEHQVCKSHVKRNTERLVEELRPLAERDQDGSLRALGVSAEQAVADLDRLKAGGAAATGGQGRGAGDVRAVSWGFASPGGGESECGLSDAVVIPGPLELVAPVDQVSGVAGGARREDRWDQQCDGASNGMVDQGAISDDAWV